MLYSSCISSRRAAAHEVEEHVKILNFPATSGSSDAADNDGGDDDDSVVKDGSLP